MPKIQIDYSNTIIYKLCCKDPTITDIYVGHTTNFLQRKHNHKTNCCNENTKNYNLNVYKYIRKNGGWDNWSMIQIEHFNCNNSNEALIRERYWIEVLKPKLNAISPYTTYEEKEAQKQNWYQNNKIEILEKSKQYYEEHKEQKKEYQTQYAQEHKEQISNYQKQYREQNTEKLAEQKKIYREANKETARLKQKEWKEANKDKIKAQRSQIIECQCGCTFTFGNKNRHLQTKIHLEYLQASNKESFVDNKQQIYIHKNKEIDISTYNIIK